MFTIYEDFRPHSLTPRDRNRKKERTVRSGYYRCAAIMAAYGTTVGHEGAFATKKVVSETSGGAREKRLRKPPSIFDGATQNGGMYTNAINNFCESSASMKV